MIFGGISEKGVRSSEGGETVIGKSLKDIRQDH